MPDGDVLLQFQDAGTEAGESSTTGIENAAAAADFGLTYACNTAASLTDGLAVRFAAERFVALEPALLLAQGCNGAPQQHQLQVVNGTGVTGTFALAYAAAPGVTIQGPPTVNAGDQQSEPITVTLTPNSCPVPTDSITATVAVTGNGFGALSTIELRIGAGSAWEQIATEPDDGRYDHVLAAYGDKIWAIGGTDDVTGDPAGAHL